MGKGTVLDYGCGTGQFLEALVTSGKKSLGVEINENARKAAERYGSVYSSIDEVDKGIEVITMWHVLEHVYDIHGLLSEFKKRMLKEDTLLLLFPTQRATMHNTITSFGPRGMFQFMFIIIQRIVLRL